MMSKRIVCIALFAVALAAAPLFSQRASEQAMDRASQRWAVGLAAGIEPLGGLPGSDGMISVKPPNLPITIGAGFRLGADDFQMGATVDWILVRENLFSFVNVYVGPGLYLALPDEVEVGARVPVGLNAYPTDWLELFFEIAPKLALFSDGTVDVPDVGIQSAVGFRFLF